MNILQLQSGENKGGIANYIKDIIKSLEKTNYNFYVLISGKEKETIASNSNKIYEDISEYNFKNFFLKLHKIISKINSYDIDFIHCHALRSAFICNGLRIFYNKKFIYTNHGLRYTQKKSKLKKFLFYLFEISVLICCDYYICIRKYDFNILSSNKINFIFRNKIKLIKTQFKFDNLGAFNKKALKKKLVISIGSLIPIKRPDKFLKIINELNKLDKDFSAIWIGEGPLRREMQQLTQNLNLPINWIGHLSNKEVHDFIIQSCLTLITSEFEMLPLNGLETLSHGNPIFALDYPGINELIQNNKNGLVFNQNERYLNIATEIKNLIIDNKRYQKMRSDSIEFFNSEFNSYSKFINNYKSLYDELHKNLE